MPVITTSADGKTAFCEITVQMTADPATKKRIMDVVEVKDGKIVKISAYAGPKRD